MKVQNPHFRCTNTVQKFVNDVSDIGCKIILESKGNPLLLQYAVPLVVVGAAAKIPALFLGATADSMRMAAKGISNKIGKVSPGNPLGRAPSNKTKEQKFAKYVASDPVIFKDLLLAKTKDGISSKISSLKGQRASHTGRSEILFNRISEKNPLDLTLKEYSIYRDLRADLSIIHNSTPMNGAAPPA